MDQINTEEELQRAKSQPLFGGFHNFTLSNAIINVPLTIKYGCNIIAITNCTFNKRVEISCDVERTLTLNNCTFMEEMCLDNIVVKGNARLQANDFRAKTSFNNSKFEKLADFWNSTFWQPTIFFKTDFNGIAVFSIVTFHENVLFTYTLIGDQLLLRGTRCNKGLDLSQSIVKGGINPFSLLVKGVASESPEDDEEFEDWISSFGRIPIKNQRETFRILKKHLQDSGNSIDAFMYWKKEITNFSKEISLMPWKNNVGYILENRIILTLNKLSNNHNSSWLLGVVFTVATGSVFFILAFVNTEAIYFACKMPDSKTLDTYIMLFINSLSPVHKLDYLDFYKPTTWTYIFDYIGRIFVGYGIYQTIKAFRRFKNAS